MYFSGSSYIPDSAPCGAYEPTNELEYQLLLYTNRPHHMAAVAIVDKS